MAGSPARQVGTIDASTGEYCWDSPSEPSTENSNVPTAQESPSETEVEVSELPAAPFDQLGDEGAPNEEAETECGVR